MSEKRQLTETLRVRVSADDLAVIREKAARAGVSIAAYCRAAALGQRAPTYPPELLRALADLGRLRSLMEAAMQKPEFPELPALVVEALTVVRDIGSDLRRRR
jgi:hypothetical protein